MRNKNKVSLHLKQVIPASITGTGFQEDRVNECSFETETPAEITAEKLTLWLMINIHKTISLARLQGDKGFNLNKPITITVKVNSKEETFKYKHSMNIEKLVAAMDKYPKVVALIFTPAPSIASVTLKSAYQHIENPGKCVIAKSTKAKEETPQVSISAPEEKLSLSSVDLTDADLKLLE